MHSLHHESLQLRTNLVGASQHGPSLVNHVLLWSPSLNTKAGKQLMHIPRLIEAAAPPNAPSVSTSTSASSTSSSLPSQAGDASRLEGLETFDGLNATYHYSKLAGFYFSIHLEQLNIQFINVCKAGAQVWVFIHIDYIDKLKQLVKVQFQEMFPDVKLGELIEISPFLLFGRHLLFQIDDLKRHNIPFLVTEQLAGEMIISDSSWFHFVVAVEDGTVAMAINDIPCTWLLDGLPALANVIIPDYQSFSRQYDSLVVKFKAQRKSRGKNKDTSNTANDATGSTDDFAAPGDNAEEGKVSDRECFNQIFGGPLQWVKERIDNFMPSDWTRAYLNDLLRILQPPRVSFGESARNGLCLYDSIRLSLIAEGNRRQCHPEHTPPFTPTQTANEGIRSILDEVLNGVRDDSVYLTVLPIFLLESTVDYSSENLTLSFRQQIINRLTRLQSSISNMATLHSVDRGTIADVATLCCRWKYHIRFAFVCGHPLSIEHGKAFKTLDSIIQIILTTYL